jgi:hypothetical protein
MVLSKEDETRKALGNPSQMTSIFLLGYALEVR